MRIDGFLTGEAHMKAPEWFGKRDLHRIARLARRVGKEAMVHTYRPRLLREPTRALMLEYGDVRETLLQLESDWDGAVDGFSAEFLDLVEAAGWDTQLYSCLASGGGYYAYAADDDGTDIDIVAYCYGKTRTLAAAGLALWAERKTRPQNGESRFGPRRAACS